MDDNKPDYADKKVLVVDDATEITDALAMIFKMQLNLTVTKAYHGEEAFEICQKEKFDLILTDIDMTPMNGVELIKALKENNLHDGPIFIMTGYAENEEYSRLSDVFFNKPIDFKVLFKEIDNVFKS